MFFSPLSVKIILIKYMEIFKMNYRELMSVLSQCELGAALLSEDGAILELYQEA